MRDVILIIIILVFKHGGCFEYDIKIVIVRDMSFASYWKSVVEIWSFFRVSNISKERVASSELHVFQFID